MSHRAEQDRTGQDVQNAVRCNDKVSENTLRNMLPVSTIISTSCCFIYRHLLCKRWGRQLDVTTDHYSASVGQVDGPALLVEGVAVIQVLWV